MMKPCLLDWKIKPEGVTPIMGQIQSLFDDDGLASRPKIWEGHYHAHYKQDD